MGQARKPLAKNAGKKTTMLSSFLIAINAVMPFMVYLGFGYLTRRIGLVDEPFLNKLNTVVFKCFFPFLMFWNLYNVDTVFHVRGRFIALCVGSLVLLWVLLGLTVPRIVKAKDMMIDAVDIACDMDNYERITMGAYEYGQSVLYRHGVSGELIQDIEGYMDLEKFGEDSMIADGVRQTEFGLIRRLSEPFDELGYEQEIGGM